MRRRPPHRRPTGPLAVALVVVLAMLAAACGAVEDVAEDLGIVDPDAPKATPDAGADTGGAADEPADQTPPPGDESRPDEPAGGPSPPAGTHQHDPPPGGFDARPDGRGPPGSLAPVLLRPEPAERLIVEVLVQEGADPRPASIDRVQRVLGQVSRKPVRVSGPTPVRSTSATWSAEDIRAAADAAGVERQDGGQAVIRLLFLRGAFAESNQTLGVAVRGDVGAVFVDRIRATGTPLVGAGPIEEAVTMHEVGHLLGLVDLYHDTGRADPEHPGHSPNPDSVMYWAVETTLVVDVLAGGPPRDFDADDLADLAAIRAGAGG